MKEKPLPADVEQDRSSKKVRCLICKEFDPLRQGEWIKKTSLKKHLESDRHKENVVLTSERHEHERMETRQLQAAYDGNSAILPENNAVPYNIRSSLFDAASNVNDPAAPDDTSVYSGIFSTPLIPTFIPLISNDMDERRAVLQAQIEELLRQAEQADEFGFGADEDITSTNVEDAFGLDGEADMDEITDYLSGITVERDYAPYPNRLLMLLDILDNLPRLRMSSNLFRMVLWILKECNVRDVPSYNAFRKMQKSLRETCGSTPTQCISSLGNIFYMNDIRDSVARDFANPEVAKHLHLYPEVTDGPISEVWQAERWKEFQPQELTPMFAKGLTHFYIEEVAELKSGQKVVPQNWYMYKGEVCSDCRIISIMADGTWQLGIEAERVQSTQFVFNYYDVIARMGGEPRWNNGSETPTMPNPLRSLAEGDELYVVMVPLWADDVSGNRSKQYNKHINIYAANSNIPGQLLQQEYFVHFVSTSPHATSPEQFSAVISHIKSTHSDPIRCYNAHTHNQCRVILRLPGLPADNPQQSEEASHMGGNANCKCRRCKAGGSHKETESNEGYHALFSTSLPRSAAEVREQLNKQIETAMYGVEKPLLDMQTATGTKDKIAQYWIDILLAKSREMKSLSPGRSSEDIATELQTWLDTQPGEKMNPLLSVSGLDPTQDTPVEILHTILLGIIKYVWYNLHTSWTDSQRNLFVIRLQSTNLDGMHVPPIQATYLIQYRNNLIGKHFKTLMQTLVFHMHDLVTPEQFTLVKSVGALGALLWVHEIDDMDTYLHDLEILIANVLDAFADVDPAKIIIKIKLHLLPHLLEDVRRWGPAIRNSTEIFECFNAIFRLCSVLSNHQAPSRDIAYKFTSLDRVKHILSGGYWQDNGKWVQAGVNVRSILTGKPIIQRHLGWAPPRALGQPGSITLPAVAKRVSVTWHETMAAAHGGNLNLFPTSTDESTPLVLGGKIVAQSGDTCAIGSWVFADNAGTSIIGRVVELVVLASHASGTKAQGIVTLESFTLSEELHPHFGMPILKREQTLISLKSASIQFIFSVQHDCKLGGCQPTAFAAQNQERQETERITKLIAHSDDDRFIVNMNNLHNATLLRRALPRYLVVPRPLYPGEERKAHHDLLAATLRSTQAVKRATTQAKRKATLERKKASKAVIDVIGNDVGSGDDEMADGGDEPDREEGSSRGTKRAREMY
ncbi:hypothetical protein AB1N83_012604 [Pleurotus pulmonarius]